MGQSSAGQSGAAGPNLDPSIAAFQPIAGNVLTGAADTDLTGVSIQFGAGPMTTQEYETMLDPNYIADHQWEREEQLKEGDEIQQRFR